jgi:hypothetical protein
MRTRLSASWTKRSRLFRSRERTARARGLGDAFPDDQCGTRGAVDALCRRVCANRVSRRRIRNSAPHGPTGPWKLRRAARREVEPAADLLPRGSPRPRVVLPGSRAASRVRLPAVGPRTRWARSSPEIDAPRSARRRVEVPSFAGAVGKRRTRETHTRPLGRTRGRFASPRCAPSAAPLHPGGLSARPPACCIASRGARVARYAGSRAALERASGRRAVRRWGAGPELPVEARAGATTRSDVFERGLTAARRSRSSWASPIADFHRPAAHDGVRPPISTAPVCSDYSDRRPLAPTRPLSLLEFLSRPARRRHPCRARRQNRAARDGPHGKATRYRERRKVDPPDRLPRS